MLRRGAKEASIRPERFFTSSRQAMILYSGASSFCIISTSLPASFSQAQQGLPCNWILLLQSTH